MNGATGQLKEYAIGVEVFDRDASYDPRLDPIVRVEARRLRSKLRQYYEREGALDDLWITMPARGYVPGFYRPQQSSHVTPTVLDRGSSRASLAILPLTALPNSRCRLFADGLTDEITYSLASLDGLQLVARTSAFQFQNRAIDARDIGAELNAQYLLDGSVRRESSTVRVFAQIVDANSGFEIWSAIYQQTVGSALAAQKAIAAKLLADLKSEYQNGRLPCAPACVTNFRAIQSLYQKGRRYLTSRTGLGIRRSIECFQQVIENDADYALGYAGLADGYSLGARYDILPPKESWKKARSAALHAVRIDNSLAEAHTALAFIELHYMRDWWSAEREFCIAIRLNPRYAPARQWYAWCLAASGRSEMAIANIKAALELDPFSPNANADLALAFYFARKYDDCVPQCENTLQLSPGFHRAHQLLGLAYLQTRDYAKAVEQFQRALAGLGRNSRTLVLLAHAYAGMGKKEEAHRLATELLDASGTYVPAVDFALLYSAIADYDRMFHWLEQAALDDDGELIWLAVDPIHDSVRRDPRFPAFLERIAAT